MSILRDEGAVRSLFSALCERYKARAGGYTRVMKAGFRYGDAASMAMITFIDRDVQLKGARRVRLAS